MRKTMRKLLCVLSLCIFLLSAVGCSFADGISPVQGKAEKLYLGNITTMDGIKPFAKAMTVVGNRIQYVGSVETARSLCDENTQVFDFGDKFIYPGFMESHTHGMFAGYRAIGQANVNRVIPSDREKYREIIKAFIAKHPNREFYMASGWIEDGNAEIDRQFLDEICPDKPLMLNTVGGHSLLLNTAALSKLGITSETAKKYGTDLVKVDKNGEPTGYICEEPAIKTLRMSPITVEDAKEYILNWQDRAFANGFTGVCDAGVELINENALPAYVQLDKENKLKLYTYAYLIAPDNAKNIKEYANKTAEAAKKFNSQHFSIVGSKVFLDGVLEAHTAWLSKDYDDQPGYHGNERFNDAAKLTELITENSKNGLSVHAHSDGDGATKFFLDCIEASQKITGNMDQRNIASHLQLLRKEDIKRMADTNTVAVVPPLWAPAVPGMEKEAKMIGKERAASQYPIKSFYDSGANVVFHSDYPISPSISAPLSVYTAVKRGFPEGYIGGAGGGEDSVRGKDEIITREQALAAMTKNVAYMVHRENDLGTLSTGKIANMTVVDMDLLHEDIEKLPSAKILATIVDGEIVYKA